jgi:hypothetical protein
MAIVILPDAQADLLNLLDLQDTMLQRWTPELWLAAEDDIFAQFAQVESGFITGPVIPCWPAWGSPNTARSSVHTIASCTGRLMATSTFTRWLGRCRIFRHCCSDACSGGKGGQKARPDPNALCSMHLCSSQTLRF